MGGKKKSSYDRLCVTTMTIWCEQPGYNCYSGLIDGWFSGLQVDWQQEDNEHQAHADTEMEREKDREIRGKEFYTKCIMQMKRLRPKMLIEINVKFKYALLNVLFSCDGAIIHIKSLFKNVHITDRKSVV